MRDVGKVLEAHGFPSVRNGSDMVDLQQALFAFVYGSADQASGALISSSVTAFESPTALVTESVTG